MSSALSIFFQNLECNWKDDDDDDDDKEVEDQHDFQEDSKKDHHHDLSNLLCHGGDKDGDGDNHERPNDRNDYESKEEEDSSSSTSSDCSTTKSLPMSAFHIQIVSDNAFSKCSQNQSTIGNQFTVHGLLPKRRHSTPTSPNDCGPRRPQGPGYSRSSSSGSLLVFQRPPQNKRSSWKRGVDHDSLQPPSFLHSSNHPVVGSSTFRGNSSLTCSRWHSGDQLLPAQTKAPLMQPIRRNTSGDDIMVHTSLSPSPEDSHGIKDDEEEEKRSSHTTKLLFSHYHQPRSTHSLHNNDFASILSARSSSLFLPVGGNVRSNEVSL